VQSLYNLAPTVTRSGLRDAAGRDRDPSVAGSSGPENNYILDGVNTTDPAFGGSGANLPFEFVQEVEIKTGAYGAEYGKATGGIFNVITKSGGNEFHGDLFGYGTTKSLVRGVKNFPFTGSAANGFSETDVGGDIGGPIGNAQVPGGGGGVLSAADEGEDVSAVDLRIREHGDGRGDRTARDLAEEDAAGNGPPRSINLIPSSN